MSHGLHEDHRYSFTLTSHDHQVGIAVIAGKVGARHLTDKVHTPLKPRHHNLALQSWALRTLADDPAEEVETLIAKRGASLDQKGIILHRMQASDGEETEPSLVCLGW